MLHLQARVGLPLSFPKNSSVLRRRAEASYRKCYEALTLNNKIIPERAENAFHL
jgi:hypothetical protein